MALVLLSVMAAVFFGWIAVDPAPKQRTKDAEPSTTASSVPRAPEVRPTSSAVETTVSTTGTPAVATTTTTTATPLVPAQHATTAPPGPIVEVSRGDASDECVDDSECYEMHITMRGFQPNALFNIVPYASEWGKFNDGADLRVDPDGNDDFQRFACDATGHEVWVVVTIEGKTYTSEKILWPG